MKPTVSVCGGHLGECCHNVPVSDLIDTTEMYLRTIFELEEEGVAPLRARIAERLEQSGPTVSQTVARMQRDGLLVVLDDRQLQFTEAGRLAAEQVMRRHRLAECMLVEVLKVPLSQVHEEACRWEHVMSEYVEGRIIDLLASPTHSPFGNPIPGIAQSADADLLSLDKVGLSLNAGAQLNVTVQRFAEPIQTETEVLAALSVAGIEPGAHMSISAIGSAVVCVGPAGLCEVALRSASSIFVTLG